jgi:5-methylcytosine-specific restriction endonuclease McrA
MPFSARVLLDSVSPAGVRLTTMEARYPRFIHSELLTHRVFCLDVDTRLYFDLPSAAFGTGRFTMTIGEFHAKWHGGAAPRPHRRRTARADGIDGAQLYDSREAARLLGYSHYTAVDGLTRRVAMMRVPGDDGRYRLRGSDLIAYANGSGEHRYSLRGRLARMRLRSCDESTREIYHTTIRDVRSSGNQPVFRVTTSDGKTITATSEHRFLTESGWSTLREAANLSLSPGGIATWRAPVRLAVNGIDPLRDPTWLREMRDRGFSARNIAQQLDVSLNRVKYGFRIFGLRATNPSEVWRHNHSTPWNKGRRYSNLSTRGIRSRAQVRRGAESHLWRGGITPERKIIGRWTKGEAFRIHRANGFRCRLCGSGRDLHVHHVDPVAHNISRAYDVTNLTTVCRDCHGNLHHRNLELVLLRHIAEGRRFESFWDTVGALRLPRPFRELRKRARVAHFVDVIAIDYVGIRPTYDVEVTGPYHNFIADGFVVHNSRNSSSSRAVPIRKMIDAVRSDPAMPVWWGRNQAGMQAFQEIGDEARALAQAEWQRALEDALAHAERLAASDINLHKQLVNRILEPFAWITVIISATEWANFFTQRTHEDAQPELKHLATLMLKEYRASEPRALALGGWHTPLILPDEEAALPLDQRLKISVARSARVSYLTHDGSRDHAKDVELYEKLVEGGANGHWSPFEHVATPLATAGEWSGNFRGWQQYRKQFAQEHAAAFPDESPLAALR